jgi:hypothetical protein
VWKRFGNREGFFKSTAVLILCLVLALFSPASAPAQPSKDRRFTKERGAWSSVSVSLFNTELRAFDRNPGRRLKFDSPDHLKTVEVADENVVIWVGAKRFGTDFNYKNCAELGWAPDSSRFFLTWTENGEVGTWHVQVYDVTSDGLHEIENLEKAPRDNFDQFIRGVPVPKDMQGTDRAFWDKAAYCEPNVVAAQWLQGSSQLLVSALVPNVGNCRYSSEFDVYRVEIPGGKIIQRYTADEAYREFGHKNLPLITR